MSLTALSARTGRHTSQPSGPGRTPAPIRRPSTASPAVPALTVTLAIPLNADATSPQANRLLEIVRELVELGQGSVTVMTAPDVDAAAADASLRGEVLPLRRWVEPFDGAPCDESWATAEQGPVPAGEVRLLTASRQVLLGGVPLPMTRLEFELLQFLADNPRRVFSRTQLLAAVWGYEHTGERTVDVHVRRLRVKVGVQVPLITTVYGVGYRLADDANLVVVPHE
jgi:two-component system OmpR family response regulator